MGRTRAASLAWWLRANQQGEARPGEKLAVVLAEMQRAPGATRHAFMEHLAYMVAAGTQHLDVAADLAQQNARERHPHITMKW